MDTKQELEHYLARTEVDSFVRDMMVECLDQQPEEPAQFLLRYILAKNAGKSSDSVAVATSSLPAQPGPTAGDEAQAPAQTHVAICAADKQAQQVRPLADHMQESFNWDHQTPHNTLVARRSISRTRRCISSS